MSFPKVFLGILLALAGFAVMVFSIAFFFVSTALGFIVMVFGAALLVYGVGMGRNAAGL
jgi:uncharacterized membrane protein